MAKQYVITFELGNTGLKYVELITEDFEKAVGHIESRINKRRDEMGWKQNKDDGDVEKYIDTARFVPVEGDYCLKWVLTLECNGEQEEEIWYLYRYDEEVDREDFCWGN